MWVRSALRCGADVATALGATYWLNPNVLWVVRLALVMSVTFCNAMRPYAKCRVLS